MMMSRPPIFIGGAGRSGTTLLRVILDSHPNIACGPELKIIPEIARQWQEALTTYGKAFSHYDIGPNDLNRLYAQLIQGLLENYLLKQKKKRIAEKSPHNIFYFLHLHNLFPQSPLIHVIRDGRDVVASLLTMNWVTPQGDRLGYTQDAGKAAQYWLNAVKIGRKAQSANTTIGRRYYEIRYEDIVDDPLKFLRELFAFIDEPWDAGVLRYYEKDRDLAMESSAGQVRKKLFRSSVGRWRKDLDGQQKEAVKNIAGEQLIRLGYAQDMNW
jgi:protein-tyrosine sulfotransferase